MNQILNVKKKILKGKFLYKLREDLSNYVTKSRRHKLKYLKIKFHKNKNLCLAEKSLNRVKIQIINWE